MNTVIEFRPLGGAILTHGANWTELKERDINLLRSFRLAVSGGTQGAKQYPKYFSMIDAKLLDQIKSGEILRLDVCPPRGMKVTDFDKSLQTLYRRVQELNIDAKFPVSGSGDFTGITLDTCPNDDVFVSLSSIFQDTPLVIGINDCFNT